MSLDEKYRELFGFDTVWHLVGKFDKYGFVSYEEYWSGNEDAIEATINVWKREGAIEIIQSEFLKKNGKIRYMVTREAE